jgi:hypothetical protein
MARIDSRLRLKSAGLWWGPTHGVGCGGGDVGAPVPNLEVGLGLRLAAARAHTIRWIADHRVQHLQWPPQASSYARATEQTLSHGQGSRLGSVAFRSCSSSVLGAARTCREDRQETHVKQTHHEPSLRRCRQGCSHRKNAQGAWDVACLFKVFPKGRPVRICPKEAHRRRQSISLEIRPVVPHLPRHIHLKQRKSSSACASPPENPRRSGSR